MKRLIIEIAIVIILLSSLGAVYALWRRDHHEMVRARQNQGTLLSDVQYWKLKDSSSAASIGALNLSIGELKDATDDQITRLLDRVTSLDVKLRDIKNMSSANLHTSTTINTYLKDSLIFDTIPIKYFRQSTRFNDVSLTVWPTLNDSLELKVQTRDCISQLAFKEPRGAKFWTSEWWNKRKIRQIIHVENPDTEISYPQYIEIKRNNK